MLNRVLTFFEKKFGIHDVHGRYLNGAYSEEEYHAALKRFRKGVSRLAWMFLAFFWLVMSPYGLLHQTARLTLTGFGVFMVLVKAVVAGYLFGQVLSFFVYSFLMKPEAEQNISQRQSADAEADTASVTPEELPSEESQ